MIPEPFRSMLISAVAGRKPLEVAKPSRIRAIDAARLAAMSSLPHLFVSAKEEAARGLQPRRRFA